MHDDLTRAIRDEAERLGLAVPADAFPSLAAYATALWS